VPARWFVRLCGRPYQIFIGQWDYLLDFYQFFLLNSYGYHRTIVSRSARAF
jgi:hypothetical protein